MEEQNTVDYQNEIFFTFRDYDKYYHREQRLSVKKNNNPYHLLIYAKANYFRQQFKKCVQICKTIDRTLSTKLLYETTALLFKATFLSDPTNIGYLQSLIQFYQKNRKKCPGPQLTDFHDNSLKQMLVFVQRAGKTQKKSIKSTDIDKDRLIEQIKKKKIPNLPYFLLSENWNKKLLKFLQNKGSYPGPISNFEIINHIFEFEPQRDESKAFLNILLFPEKSDKHKYYVLSKNHWKLLGRYFELNQIKRYFSFDVKKKFQEKQFVKNQSCVKTLIQIDGMRKILQWQTHLFWQKSVFPILHDMYGYGQLKQQTSLKDFVVVSKGIIYEPSSVLKYVKINKSILPSVDQKYNYIIDRIFYNFDLQSYEMDLINPEGAVGLANLGNTCYMNAAIQALSSLKQFTSQFLSNRFLKKLNILNKNKEGSNGIVACAFGDLIKRMWCNSDRTRYIDPTLFKRIFGQRYPIFDGNHQQDAQQFLMFLLDCIHEDLNTANHDHDVMRESMGGKEFHFVKNLSIKNYRNKNNSLVSQSFHAFHFQQIICDSCTYKTYKFENSLMLHIQAPEEFPKISLYFVRENQRKQALSMNVCLKDIQKVGQLEETIREEFKIKRSSRLLMYLFDFSDQDNCKFLDEKQEIKKAVKFVNYKKEGYFFIHEISEPTQNEEIIRIIYEDQDKKMVGFPRFATFPKNSFPNGEIQENDENKGVFNLIYSTFTEIKLEKLKKPLDLFYKKTKDHPQYSAQFKVLLKQIQNSVSSSYEKLLGSQNIPLPNLYDCLKKMMEPQIIDNWKCQKCKKSANARKTGKVYSTNKYLIIQIKRFTDNGKIHTKIDYPIKDLNMSHFVEQAKQKKQSQLLYNLQAVVLHRGSLNSGHYTCICLNSKKDKWLEYDDEEVRQRSEERVVDSCAYILIYERAEQISLSQR